MGDRAVLQCEVDGNSPESLINYLLLELQSTSVKSEEHFVQFDCADGTRYIHRLILKAKLPSFDETEMSIPVPAAIFDAFVQYLYKGKVTSVEKCDLIGVCKAAKCLGCSDLQREIKRAFQCRLPEFLQDPEFLKECSSDMLDWFAEVLQGLGFNEETTLGLVQRLAPYFSNRSLREAVFSCRQSRRMACATGSGLLDAITLQLLPCKVDFTSIECSRAIILNGKIFARNLGIDAVMVLDVFSGEVVQEIAMPGVKGITFCRGELFAWTSSEIFLIELDQISGNYSLELAVTSSDLDNVCVIKRTGDGMKFANGCENGVKIINAEGELSAAVCTTIMEKSDWRLIGTHEDALIVFQQGSDRFLNSETREILYVKKNLKSLNTMTLDGVLFASSIPHIDGESAGPLEITRTDFRDSKHKVSTSTESYVPLGSAWPLIPCFMNFAPLGNT